MQLVRFILHGWLCYYNDGEVVKEKLWAAIFSAAGRIN